MKIVVKKTVLLAALVGVAGFVGLKVAHAQTTATSAPATSSDDIVQLTADEANLTPVSLAGLPHASTYWVIVPGGYRGNVNALPYPCLPDSLTNSPIYDITGNIFLVDATGGQVLTGGSPFGTRANNATIASALLLQANTIENLILQVQGAAASPTLNANDQPLGGGFSPLLSITNGMYLTIAPGGTNQYVVTVIDDSSPVNYELWWTPVLANPASPWTVLAVGATGQTNFTVDASVYPTGFYRAIWDNNGIPIWEMADPNNPDAGILTITIDSPANNTVLN